MTQRRVLTESEFLAETESRDYRDSLKNILDESLGLGLVIQWWSVGGSIRVATPFHTDPITVAWVFPPDRGWMGMRDFNIGFDSWTAKTVPDSKTLLESYAKRVSALAGAEPVKSDYLMAYHLRPSDVVSGRNQIVEELSWIVGEVAGL